MRKIKRKTKVPGRRKNRHRIVHQWRGEFRRRLTLEQAATPATWKSVDNGTFRILNGKHPETGDALPVGEDGCEFLP